MPLTQSREISAASRLDNVRYAIRDLACVADEVIKQGHKILPLNIGDPLTFDFQTPARSGLQGNARRQERLCPIFRHQGSA